MEEIGEDGRRGSRTGQTFGLEGLEARVAKPLAFGIEQPPERSADAVGRKRLLERLRLEQNGKAGQRALGYRRGAKRGQRRPEMLLGGRIDRHAFGCENFLEPLRGPSHLRRLVDARQRLQRDAFIALFGKA